VLRLVYLPKVKGYEFKDYIVSVTNVVATLQIKNSEKIVYLKKLLLSCGVINIIHIRTGNISLNVC
jgi:hypothetical protein